MAVKVEAIAILILDGELPEPPRLVHERLDDVRAQRTQLGVGGVDVGGKHPMNGRLEWRLPSTKEDRDLSSRYRAELLLGIEPGDVEAEHVAIVRLRTFDVGDRQLRH